jgi:hypothetical protein
LLKVFVTAICIALMLVRMPTKAAIPMAMMLEVMTALVAWAFTEPSPCLIFSANIDIGTDP